MPWHSSVDRDRIHPGLVDVVEMALEYLEDDGQPFKVYSGLRTFAEQDELYSRGRSMPGKVVTKAKGGQSMHNYGLAIDCAPLSDPSIPQGGIDWPDPYASFHLWTPLEQAVQDAADAIDEKEDDGIDFEWGGRWRFRDCPHVQVRTTIKELKAGDYPTAPADWLVFSHTGFLFDTPWIYRRAQFLLNALGYGAGMVDGVVGRQTVRAIGDFCEDIGISPVDDVTRDIVAALVERHAG